MGIKLIDKINAEQTAGLAEKNFPEFKTGDIIAMAKTQGMSRASAYRLINLFCNAYGIITTTRYGHYRKAAADNDDASKSGGTEAQSSGTEPQSGGTENESN